MSKSALKKGTEKIEAKAKRRSPYLFGETVVTAGASEQVELPVSRLPSGGWASLPIAIVHGVAEGPTVWLSGAVHGDELNGIEIVRQLLSKLDAAQLKGTVLAVPIVNVFGTLTGSRYLPDRRDLNRSFPGSPKGSLASRLAHLVTQEVVARCSFGIDFHTGSGGRANASQVRVDLEDASVRPAADAFRAPLLVHAKTRPASLRHTAIRHGVQYVLFEGGEAHRFDDQVIRDGVEGALRVLCFLGMIDAAPAADPSLVCRQSTWVRARYGGIFRPCVALGQRVTKGMTLATVTDAFNLHQRQIHSPTDGVVVGSLQQPIVHAGDALVHVGRV